MMTPAQVDRWCDSFWEKNGRNPFWDELIRFVQADALGQPEPPPMTDDEIARASEANSAHVAPPPAGQLTLPEGP